LRQKARRRRKFPKAPILADYQPPGRFGVMRVRQTGDATVTQKPRPKPQPRADDADQLGALRRANAKLRWQLAKAQEQLAIIQRRNARATTMTKAQHSTLAKVFHPDKGTHATKAQLNNAMQVFNSIRFNIVK
jgi:hypothetical protein